MIKENDILNNSFNDDMLSYFPEKTFATASVSLNPMAYYDLFEAQYGDEFENIGEFKEETGLDLEDLFESVQGSNI